MTGGIAHNIGQLIIAYFVVQNAAVGWYLPVLIITKPDLYSRHGRCNGKKRLHIG